MWSVTCSWMSFYIIGGSCRASYIIVSDAKVNGSSRKDKVDNKVDSGNLMVISI